MSIQRMPNNTIWNYFIPQQIHKHLIIRNIFKYLLFRDAQTKVQSLRTIKNP